MKVKKMKKLLALSITAIMTVGMLAGCGSAGENEVKSNDKSSEVSEEMQDSSTESAGEEPAVPKDPVILEWYYAGNGPQQDTQKVEDYVNELLKDYEGLEHVSIHLNCFIGDDYAQQVLLAQTSGKQMDIVQTYKLNYVSEVNNGTFLALDDYLNAEEFAALKNELPEWLWDTLKVNDSTYIVPNYQMGSNDRYIVIPKEYAEYADLNKLDSINITDDPASLTELADEMEKITLAVSEATGMTKYVEPLAINYAQSGNFIQKDRIDNNSGIAVNNGTTEVINIYQTESFKELSRMAGELVEKGLFPKDAAVQGTDTFKNTNMLNDKAYAVQIVQSYGDDDVVSALLSKSYGFEVLAFRLHDHYAINMGWGAGGNGVTSFCENPVEALMFIEALNTEKGKEIYNAVVYGLEDVHYEKLDDENIRTLEYDGAQGGTDTTYAAWKWVIGNTNHAYLNQGCMEGDKDIINAVNNDPNNKVSELMGFWSDTEPISVELSQCAAVVTEYKEALWNGSMGSDWEAYYDEFMTKMDAAGVQKVIDEVQTQINAFISTR